jgi:hypothetical protein
MVGLSLIYSSAGYLCYRYGPPANAYTFTGFAKGLDGYREFSSPWRPRVFSTYLSSLVMPVPYDARIAAIRAGQWNGFWFLACCCVYCLHPKRQCLFLIFGTFGALMYGFVPTAEWRTYPWDMPAVWFAALIYFLSIETHRFGLLFFAILFGTGFKETIGVCSILFLLNEKAQLRNRLAWFGASAVSCVALKIAIDLLTHNNLGFTQQLFDSDGQLLLLYNIKFFFIWQGPQSVFHPLFTNAGTLVLAILIVFSSGRHQTFQGWKYVILLWLVGIIVMGRINEYRIFYEMIPFSLVVIHEKWDEMTRHDHLTP